MGARRRRRRTEEAVEAEPWDLALPEHLRAPGPVFRVLAAS